MPTTPHVSLKTKMTATVFLLVAVILLTGGFGLLWYLESRLRESIANQEFTLVSRIAEDIDYQITQAQEIVVKAAADIPAAFLDNPDRAQTLLDNRFKPLSGIFDNGIFLFSGTGKMVAESPAIPGRRGKDYSFRRYFRTTMATGRPRISTPYFSSQAHHHPAINFTAPIRDNAGKIIGVLAGSVDLTRDNMLGRVVRTRVGKTGYLYLYSRDRLMIMHPNPERVLKRDVPPGANRLFDKAIEGFEGSGKTVNSRGLHTLSSFKHLSSVDWILGANYPEEEAFEPIKTARRYFALGMTGALLLAILVVWLVMQRLTAPLLRITRHVETLTTGRDKKIPLRVNTRDEIAVLANSFNRLMTEVEMRKQSVVEQLSFLQTLMDTIPNPIYYKNLEGEYQGCNRPFEQIFEKSHDRIIGKKVQALFPPRVAEFLAAQDAELIQQPPGQVQSFECTLNFADASLHDVLFYKAVFNDRNGDPVGVVGTMIDITSRKAIEVALAEQREFSENLLQNSAVPCFVVDTDHHVLTWTRACEELTGVSAATVLGSDQHWQAFYPQKRPCLVDLVIDGDMERVVELYDTFADSPFIPEGVRSEGWFPAIGGKPRYILFEAAPIRDGSGNLIAAIETIHDLTHLKQVEAALRESEQSYRALIERSPDAIIVHNEKEILFANQAADQLFGIDSPEHRAGIGILDLVAPDYHQAVRKRIRLAEKLQKETEYIELKAMRLDGTVMDLEAASTPVIYSGQRAVQTVLRDITDRKELQERTWRQANFDSLTGIPNRIMFFDRLHFVLGQAKREKRRVALLYIDLDRFKQINDNLGHAAGDVLLREAARRIGRCLRKTDTLARIGGDEFAAIMGGFNDPATLAIVLDRILKSLDEPFPLDGGEGRVSGSIGVAFYPEDGSDAATLIRHADVAMYRSKDQGRNTWHLYASDRTAGQEDVRVPDSPG